MVLFYLFVVTFSYFTRWMIFCQRLGGGFFVQGSGIIKVIGRIFGVDVNFVIADFVIMSRNYFSFGNGGNCFRV